ncbi:MAG: hypothetical protein CMF45_03640 [Legionellales bacterium]|nr:hypothetical protein [Legionellales bacterium]
MKRKRFNRVTDSLYDLGVIAPNSRIVRGVIRSFIADAVKVEVEQEVDFVLSKLPFFSTKRDKTLIREEELIDSFTLV